MQLAENGNDTKVCDFAKYFGSCELEHNWVPQELGVVVVVCFGKQSRPCAPPHTPLLPSKVMIPLPPVTLEKNGVGPKRAIVIPT